MDNYGSYRRFDASQDKFPSNRVGNKNLPHMLVDESLLLRHERNIDPLNRRSANRYADTTPVQTDYGRPTNLSVLAESGGGFFDDLWSGIKEGVKVAAPFIPLIL
tara:strand:+ start:5378 stop:5692 length:315 start_codon:yes stop_codon:yes gene_type:complete